MKHVCFTEGKSQKGGRVRVSGGREFDLGP